MSRTTLTVLAVCSAATLGNPARAGEDSLVQIAAGTGARTVERSGNTVVVTYVDGEKTERQTIDLAAMAPDSTSTEARAIVLPGDVLVLAIVARRAEQSWRTYHWARDRAGPEKARSEWVVSKPVFRSSGDAFRIVELRAVGSGIETTFRRGEADPKTPERPVAVEEKIYSNANPTDPEVRYDRAGEMLVEGTLRHDPPATLGLRIGADGVLRLRKPDGQSLEVALSSDDGNAVVEALERLAASGGGPFSQRRNVLEIAVDPSARWRWVQWAVQVLIDPWGVNRLRFVGEGREPIDLRLPEDGGLVGRERSARLDVALVRRGEGGAAATIVLHPGAELRLPPQAEEPDEQRRYAAMEPLRTVVAEQRRTKPSLVAEVSTPPPRGGEVPAGDVLLVLRAVREAGAENVYLGGAPSPRRSSASAPR